MKRLLPILFFLTCSFLAHAQVIDVCADTDTIILRFANYQYGEIQWQQSYNNIDWEDIAGANDTLYQCLPTNNMFYRAVVSHPTCPTDTSEVSHIQVKPWCYAGPDRTLTYGDSYRMMAHMTDDAVGEWQVLSGNGAVLSDIHDPRAIFSGSDSLYVLTWSLTNACGTSTDTITIRYTVTEFYDNIVIVDTTDLILSDSTELADGLYIVVFNDPVPDITDTTVIVSIDGSFLRKVIHHAYDGDTCVMLTVQGTIDDILKRGVINFDLLANPNESDTSKFVRLHRLPTRAEILADSSIFKDKYFYIKKEESLSKGISNKLGEFFNFSLSFPAPESDDNLWSIWDIVVPELQLNIASDLVFSVEKDSSDHTTKVSFGLIETTITADFSFSILSDFSIPFDIWKIVKPIFAMVGPVPVETTFEFSIPLEISAHVPNIFDISASTGAKFNFLLTYESGSLKPTTHFERIPLEIQTSQANYALNFNISVGPRLDFKLYHSLGPYIYFETPKYSYTKCYAQTHPYGTDISSELAFNAAAGVELDFLSLGWFTFNAERGINLWKTKSRSPSKITIMNGNNQHFVLGETLEPIIFRITDSKNKPSEGIHVHFTPMSGGTVYPTAAISGADGLVQATWTPGNIDAATLRATIYGCNNEIIDEKTVTAYGEQYDCSQSSLSASFINHDGHYELRGTGGHPPYQYFIDNFHNTWQQSVSLFTPDSGIIYRGTVKDLYGCMAHTAYACPTNQCDTSNLSLDYYLYETLGEPHVWLEGKNGTPPYRYQIDGNLTYFQDEQDFIGVAPGSHIAYVKDATQCIKSQPFSILQPSDELSFIIYNVDNITPNSADVTCAIISTDQSILGEHGVCWSTSHNPTIQDSHVSGTISNPNGGTPYFYTCELTNLIPDTAYYARAYVTSYGIPKYSNEREINTPPFNAPTVITNSAFNVTSNSATCGGIVTSDNGFPVTARGVCWNALGDTNLPTINGPHTIDGSGLGEFYSQIQNLSPNTDYKVRAYATNANGTSYGWIEHFTTQPTPQFTVTTDSVGSVTATTATVHGTATALSGSTITIRGVYWDRYGDPDPASSTTHVEISSDNSTSFAVQLTGLTPNTQYHVQAFAGNVQDIQVGSVHSFYTTPCIPEVTTYDPIAVTDSSAGLLAFYVNECAPTPITIGICWDTVQNPTVSSSPAYSSSSTQPNGGIQHIVTGLQPGTTYYFRAFATTDFGGPYYGEQKTFTTSSSCQLPSVTTLSVTDIGYYSAVCNVNLISDGGCDSTECGICWGTHPALTITQDTFLLAGYGLGAHACTMNSLEPESIYYVRAFAYNSAGVTYGNVLAFRTDAETGTPCGTETVMDYDSNVYHTVLLGAQCWMKENLRTTHFADGTVIPLGMSASTTDAYRYYPTDDYNDNVNLRNVALYGYLYNWPAVMHNESGSSANPSGVQGICPSGWHVPSEAEWIQLVDYLQTEGFRCGTENANVAKAVASISGWDTSTMTCAVGHEPELNNASGFTAVAGGYVIGTSTCSPTGEMAYFWTCTPRTGPVLNNFVYYRNIGYGSATLSNGNGMKMYELSVRCIKNQF